MHPRTLPLLIVVIGAVLAARAVWKYRSIRTRASGEEDLVRSKADLPFVQQVLQACPDVAGPTNRRVIDYLVDQERRRQLLSSVFFSGLAVAGLVAAFLVQTFDAQPADTAVFVASRDGVSRAVPMTESGLCLRDALELSTLGSAEQSTDDEGEPIMVALSSKSEGTAHIWYYPTKLVWLGEPGDVRLRSGDGVRLVSLADTSLGVLDPVRDGTKFEVRGLIERPGKYETQEISEVVMNVHTETYGRTFETNSVGPDVIIVHRSASDAAPHEHYCIPLSPPHANRVLLDSRIMDGDVIEYARLGALSMSTTRRRKLIPPRSIARDPHEGRVK